MLEVENRILCKIYFINVTNTSKKIYEKM